MDIPIFGRFDIDPHEDLTSIRWSPPFEAHGVRDVDPGQAEGGAEAHEALELEIRGAWGPWGPWARGDDAEMMR